MKATRSQTRATKMVDAKPKAKPEKMSDKKPARLIEKRVEKEPIKKPDKIKTNPEVEKYMKFLAECQTVHHDLEVYGPDKIKQLQKNWNAVYKQSIRNCEEMELKQMSSKPSRTRSGKKRGFIPRQDYTEGKLIAKGMDEALDKFAPDELEWLATDIKKYKSVQDLTYDHIKYLISDIFLSELQAIQKGEIESYFHKVFHELDAKEELLSEVKLTLFTNEQRDYINGLLQTLFEANVADKNGDVKHNDIKYAAIVMLAESTMRIVKFIYGFESLDETYAFMKKHSREAYGISDDEED